MYWKIPQLAVSPEHSKPGNVEIPAGTHGTATYKTHINMAQPPTKHTSTDTQ